MSTFQSLYFITLITFTTLLSICTKIKKCADNDEEDVRSPRINKKFIDSLISNPYNHYIQRTLDYKKHLPIQHFILEEARVPMAQREHANSVPKGPSAEDSNADRFCCG